MDTFWRQWLLLKWSTLTSQLRKNKINLAYSMQDLWTKKECNIVPIRGMIYFIKRLCYFLNVYSFLMLIRGIYSSLKTNFLKFKNPWQSWRYAAQLSRAPQNEKSSCPVFGITAMLMPVLTLRLLSANDWRLVWMLCLKGSSNLHLLLSQTPPHLPSKSFNQAALGYEALPSPPFHPCFSSQAADKITVWPQPLFSPACSSLYSSQAFPPIDHLHIKSHFSVYIVGIWPDIPVLC